MSFVRVQNANFRRDANLMDYSFYPTEPHHCETLGQLFKWPEEEVCVLEPSIGEGIAVKAVTRPDINVNVKIFGVELDDARAKTCKEDPQILECINCDFTNGAKIKNQAFTFCFGNPPYQDDDDTDDGKKSRMERTFLEHVTQRYLKIGGILVWVIPYRMFIDNSYLKYLYNHYEALGVYKFWPDEYKKWHQIVFIGRKTATRVILADNLSEIRAMYDTEDKVPTLPATFEGTDLYRSIEVMPSESDKINLFAARVFDPEQALRFLSGKPDISDFNRMVNRHTTQKEYTASDLGRPPIPPKKDSLYLMITAGAGQGLAGEIGKDAHLQRGVAEIVEEVEYIPDPKNPEEELAKVTSRTKVTMTLIETDGKITVLE